MAIPTLLAVVDCTYGSDETGQGTAVSPYKTITFGQNQVSPGIQGIIAIQNGPCVESTIVLPTLAQLNYNGMGDSPVEIPNGVSYTATSSDFNIFLFDNLHFGSFNYDASTVPAGSLMLSFFNSILDSGSITQQVPTYLTLFDSCQVTLSELLLTTAFHESNAVQIDNIGTGSYVVWQSGQYQGNTSLADNVYISFEGGNIDGAIFTGSGSQSNPSAVYVSTLTQGTATYSGVDNFIHDDVLESRSYQGSAVISGTTANLVFKVYGSYVIHPIATSSGGGTPCTFWVSNKTSTGAVVNGQDGCTFDWVLYKAI